MVAWRIGLTQIPDDGHAHSCPPVDPVAGRTDKNDYGYLLTQLAGYCVCEWTLVDLYDFINAINIISVLWITSRARTRTHINFIN